MAIPEAVGTGQRVYPIWSTGGLAPAVAAVMRNSSQERTAKGGTEPPRSAGAMGRQRPDEMNSADYRPEQSALATRQKST
jgi:hypothetical protein